MHQIFLIMKSVFNPQDNQEIIERIEKLTSSSTLLWGKMTVDQMLKHCQAPIDVAFGDLKMKPNFIFLLLGKLFKRMILNNDFKKNSTTAPEFIVKDPQNFDEVQQELIKRVKRFATEGINVIKNQKHPFFGNMTYEEWDTLHYKHLDHHLKQFGV